MSQASWEPLSNLTNCSDAIASFEETLKTQGGKNRYRFSILFNFLCHPAKKKNTPKKRGFARGLTAERIIGAVRVASGIMFLMKWEERSEDDVDLVTARQANIKCPQVVIKYYESVVEIQLKPV